MNRQHCLVSLDLSGRTITLKTGNLAQQASASVLARMGDTMVLSTVVEGKVRTDIDYFPLTVEYIERLYAGGRIKGSRWVKREGRPSDDAILAGRLIDRSIRPLFPKEYKNEVQIMITVLSVDQENEPDVLSIIATSAALAISGIPWKGPVGAVRIGYVKEGGNGAYEFLVNPGMAETELSELNLVVSGIKNKTLMIEANARQAAESIVLEAIEKANEQNAKIIEFIEDFAKKIGQKKQEVVPDQSLIMLIKRIEKSYKEDIVGLIKNRATKEGKSQDDNLIATIIETEKVANSDSLLDKKLVAKAVESVLYKIIREDILFKGKRPDGRKIDEMRKISAEISVLPRTHGSAIFQRGDTQALTVVTLGSPRLEQLIESPEGEESKRYIHHYSMPPYSVGETGRIGIPTRREIGHGALAEKALEAVIPKQEKFPYTIRVVSEILSSNGSTSMAAVCGSTLALMDAGVPIDNLVAGIATGMVSSSTGSELEKYVLLTDILGLEDFAGDMDFKVAGTKKGITAIQLDVKILGLTKSQIAEVFEKAKSTRLSILEKMEAVIPQPKPGVSPYAPKIEQIHIPVEKIGDLIGPGGRVIKNIIAQTGASVDVEDDGLVTISGTSEDSVAKALEWIKGLTREIKIGEIFDGVVKRILPFGAFIEFLPGKEGMVHVSQMAAKFVRNPSEVVQLGQKVKVKVIEIDEQARINLSMLLDADKKVRSPQEEHFPPSTVSEHPLTRQFRREKASTMGRGIKFGQRRTRPSGFRKIHYG